MIINIHNNTTIRQIQEQFSTKYPYLNLIFFNRGYKAHPSWMQQGQAFVDTCIGNIKKKHVSGLLEILHWNTIADVEKAFELRFGLKVQVLQNSHDHWIQPAGVDHLTLREQNEAGYKAGDHIIHPEYDSRIEDNEY